MQRIEARTDDGLSEVKQPERSKRSAMNKEQATTLAERIEQEAPHVTTTVTPEQDDQLTYLVVVSAPGYTPVTIRTQEIWRERKQFILQWTGEGIAMQRDPLPDRDVF
jgi:hypothetical protein